MLSFEKLPHKHTDAVIANTGKYNRNHFTGSAHIAHYTTSTISYMLKVLVSKSF